GCTPRSSRNQVRAEGGKSGRPRTYASASRPNPSAAAGCMTLMSCILPGRTTKVRPHPLGNGECPHYHLSLTGRGERTMKTRAAVAWKAGQPLEVTTVDLAGPKTGEVLVEIKASGVCHTDEFTRSGGDPEGL